MLLVDISTRFISLPADRLDSEILRAQREVCECLDLDISSLWQMPPDNPSTVLSTHIYVPPDYNVPVLEMDAQDFFPWSMTRLARGETVVLSRMTDIPPEGARDLEIFRYYQIQSSICFPLSAGGGPMFGAVAFDTFRRQLTWSSELIDQLGLVAQVFANALFRKRSDQALRESETRLRGIFEGSLEGIIRTTVDGKVLFANPAMANMLGYDSPEEFRRSTTDTARQVWADPEERSRFVERLKERGVRSYECRFKRKDGSPILVSLSVQSVRGPDGRIAHYDGFVQDISERKRTDEALRQSEERFRALAESALVGIYILQDGKYAYVNPAMARVFGHSVAEMTSMSPHEIVQPGDHGMVDENIRRRISGEVQAIQYEVRGRHKDGSTRDVEVYGTRVEMNGRPALIGTLVDITERKRAEAALAKSRSLLAETEEIGKVGGWEIDIDTMNLTWTPEVYAIHEVDPSYVPSVEQAILFYTPASRTVIERLVRRAVEHGEPYDVEMEMITAKGRLRTVHSIGRVDLEHRRVYGFFQDITERNQTKLALTESEKRYRTLFETAPAGIIMVSPDGYVLTANSLQARLFGYESPRLLEGFYAPLFIVEQDRERASRDMMAIAEGNGLTGRTYTAVRRDGSEFAAEVTGAVLRGPSHEVQAYLYLTRDVTKKRQDESERVQLRQELAHLGRVMAMSELSTSLAHEINQPLGAILNNAEAARSLLAQAKEERPEIGEIIQDIIQDAQRAGDVIRRIRGLVKRSEAKFEPLDVNILIEDVVRLMNNSFSLNNVTLRLDLKPDLAKVRGDRVRLQQVLMNLMTNAVDAMKHMPSRILAVRSTAPAANTVAVNINDTGTGIAEAGLDDVFRPFYTTKKDGLGMGLTICQSIIEEHGGRIWQENNPGGGATFSFILKVWTGEPVAEPEKG
jgi:PAS domain S-box-containing protein